MEEFKLIKEESLYNFSYLDFWAKARANLVKMWVFHCAFFIGILCNFLSILVLGAVLVDVAAANLPLALALYAVLRAEFVLTVVLQVASQRRALRGAEYAEAPIKFFYETDKLAKKSKTALILAWAGVLSPFVFCVAGYLHFIVPLQNKHHFFAAHRYYEPYILYHEKKARAGAAG